MLSYEQFWEGFRRLLGAGRLLSTSEPIVNAMLGLDSLARVALRSAEHPLHAAALDHALRLLARTGPDPGRPAGRTGGAARPREAKHRHHRPGPHRQSYRPGTSTGTTGKQRHSGGADPGQPPVRESAPVPDACRRLPARGELRRGMRQPPRPAGRSEPAGPLLPPRPRRDDWL